jgi:alpha-ketoglutarate-dependent sulfate ester dioxygenase
MEMSLSSCAPLKAKPISARIGAEITGIALGEPLDSDVIAAVRRALLEYKVIFFRDQHLDDQAMVAFARRFGELTSAHPTVPALAGHPEVLDLDYSRTDARANNWHSDVTFVDRPPMGSVLRALVIPPAGGDTLWANTVTAYNDLPPSLRLYADSLSAVHSNAYDYVAARVDLSESLRERKAIFEATQFETIHPVVRVHPETEERGLFLGTFARRLVGYSPAESFDILRLLQSYIQRPENQVRWRWRAGDVAFWDNRNTQHYAVADYGDSPRHVRRVTIVGDVPAGINGQKSTVIKGDSTRFIHVGRLAA